MAESEIRDSFAEILERAAQLGANDEQVEWLAEHWWTFDDDEQERISRLNDVSLGAELARMLTPMKVPSNTPVLDDELDAHAALARAHEHEDWELLALELPTILDAVGDDAGHAYRLYNLEQTANKPRVGVLHALERVAWPHGKP